LFALQHGSLFPMSDRFTKAMYARQVSRIVRRSTLESGELAEGMWNPMFCSADAIPHAKSFCEAIRHELDAIETMCMDAERR
jgi:hypothetical protein